MSFHRRPHPSHLGQLAAAALGGALVGVLFTRNFLETGKKIQHLLDPDYGAGDPAFVRSMSQLLGPPLLEGNQVRLLNNGSEIFPAMLRAIRSARRTITMENFVWAEGQIAWDFADALAERARAGVSVHFLQDALGCSNLHTGSMAFLKDSPVEVEIFRFLQLTRMNFRTHRKLLTIDGKVGFIGGVAISDAWDGNGDQPDIWRDTHYHVEGPVVGQLQQAFTENWMQTRAVLLHGDEYFPKLEPAGDDVCQVFKSQASEGSDGARVMLLLSIAAARKSIRIANAYFIPDELTIRT
ncbi:MAG: cardiolipin synthase B, partial [Chthoniobacteraceae bacterium]